MRAAAVAARERGDLGESVAAMMRLGVLLEDQGRASAAAEAFGAAADTAKEAGDPYSTVRAQAIQASNLYVSADRAAAFRVLEEAADALDGLPDWEQGPPRDRREADEARLAADARAVLDVHAAYILGCEGRFDEGVARAYAAVNGFRAVHEDHEAERATVLAAQLTLAAAGPVAARGPLQELLATLAPGGDARRQVGDLLEDASAHPEGADA